MSLATSLTTGVEYETNEDNDSFVDIPDAPRDPERSGGSGRNREVVLKRHRLRFNWDAPDENKTSYLDENDGLAPGQSSVFEYEVKVQRKDGATTWTTIETETTKDLHYVFHAIPDITDLAKTYRALITSLDRDGNRSSTSLSSNSGDGVTIEGGGDGGGSATEAPKTPVAPVAYPRVRKVILKWKDRSVVNNVIQDQSDNAQPIVYEIHAVSGTNWPADTSLTKIGQTPDNSFIVNEYYDASTGGQVAFVKKDYLKTFSFRLKAKSKVGTSFIDATPSAFSSAVTASPARGPLQTVGTDKPDAPSAVNRKVVGPRKIRWNWTDTDDPSVDRYKIVIQNSNSANSGFTTYETRFPKHSHFTLDIPVPNDNSQDSLITKYWKATVYSQTSPNNQGLRTDSNPALDPAGGSQIQDFASGAAKVPPTSPTNITVKRRPKKIVVRWHHEPTDDMGRVTYQVHITKNSGFTPSNSTKVASTDSTVFPATQWSNNGTLIDFVKPDAKSTFYIVIVAKNSKGLARSVQISAAPADRITASNKSSTDDGDVYEIIANRFVADDGGGDRIVIADTTSAKAQIKFVGNNGSTIFEVKGGGGNVQVRQGYVDFSGGLVAPYQGGGGIPNTATGINGSIGVSGNRLWWRGSNGWRWVNIAADGSTVNGGTG